MGEGGTLSAIHEKELQSRTGESTILEEGMSLLGLDDFGQLLAQFVTLLTRHQIMKAAGIVTLQSDEENRLTFCTMACEALDSVGHKRLDDAIISSLLEQLTIVGHTQAEYLKGVAALTAGGETYGCVLFGGLEARSVLVVWRWEQSRPGEASVDFLAHQAQGVYRWQKQLAGAQELIYKDDLTGLYNYRYLEMALETEIRRAQRFAMNFALLFIDLDNFKPINDCHGHLSGSLVLKQVANLLTEGLREVDSVFRYGGDEYVVLLLGASSASGYLTAERIRNRVANHPFLTESGATVYVTASIGVAAYPEHAGDKDVLIKIADQCMYKGKHGGKNRVVVMESTLEGTKNGVAESDEGALG